MAHTADTSKANVLVAGCQGLVCNLAWKIHQRLPARIEIDELIAYGQVGLIEAANKFDPDRGIRFTTFAYYRIRGAIFDGLSEMSWFTARDYHRGRYERLAADAMESEADRPEEASDTAAENSRWLTGVSTRLAVVSLMSSAGEEGDVATRANERGARPSDRLEVDELIAALRESVARLPDQQRALIEMAYYDGLTLKESGERLGISKSWASRLHDKALQSLSEGLIRRGVT